MTKYDVFMHYYNDDIGRPVTNRVETDWLPALTTIDKYTNGTDPSDKYLTLDYIKSNPNYQKKFDRDEQCLENLYISKYSTSNQSENTTKYEELIVNSMTINNPKYDMIFVWDGLGVFESTDDKQFSNQLYFDTMKRLKFQPWFFHSTYHSLKAAVTKASQLIDLFGKEHIMIGKEVALDQYIDVV